MIRNRPPAVRRGVSLLEVMASVAISATLMTSSFVVLRSSYAAWQAHEADLDRAAEANAVLRQLIQSVRQSTGVLSVSGEGNSTGTMTVNLADASEITWGLSGSQVTHQVDAGSTTPVANDINGLEFVGYEADGATTTTNGPDIRSIRCSVTTNLPAGGTRTVSSHVWLRSW